jgi:hypothetical protein
MLRTVNFNGKRGFMAEKIDNVASDGALSGESGLVRPQKIIPKMIFLFCGVCSQFARAWGQNFVAGEETQTPVSFAATPFEKGAFKSRFGKGFPRSWLAFKGPF